MESLKKENPENFTVGEELSQMNIQSTFDSCDEMRMWDEIYISLGSIILIFNLTQIAILIKTNKTLPNSLVFLLNLAASDAFVGFMLVVVKMMHIYNARDISPFLNGLEQFLRYSGLRLTLAISLTSLFFITVDRFIKVIFPLRYRVISRKFSIYVSLFLWVVSITGNLLSWFLRDGEDAESLLRRSNVVLPCLTISMIFSMSIAYTFIWTRIHQQNKKFILGKAGQHSAAEEQRLLQEKKLGKLATKIVISFSLCSLPYSTVAIIKSVSSIKISNGLMNAVSVLYISNSILNTLIYFEFVRKKIIRFIKNYRRTNTTESKTITK